MDMSVVHQVWPKPSCNKQEKRLEDNNREWTGMEFTKSQMAVENREKWRTLVMPQQPLRLRDT